MSRPSESLPERIDFILVLLTTAPIKRDASRRRLVKELHELICEESAVLREEMGWRH